MCGRYVQSRPVAEVAAAFGAAVAEAGDRAVPAGQEAPAGAPGPEQGELTTPSWNVAPTQRVPVVLERRPRDRPDGDPERTVRGARWGLVPGWATDVRVGARMINARVETVAEKPAFRAAARSRRCVVPADGWYEWFGAKGSKQPFLLAPPDQLAPDGRPRPARPLALAGLYELWRDRSAADDDPARWVLSCTVLTTTADGEHGVVHDRCPLVVDDDLLAGWLSPDDEDVHPLLDRLRPAVRAGVGLRPVPVDVGQVRRDGPDLVRPLPADQVLADPRADA